MPTSRPMKNNFFCFVSSDSEPVSERPGTDIFIFLTVMISLVHRRGRPDKAVMLAQLT